MENSLISFLGSDKHFDSCPISDPISEFGYRTRITSDCPSPIGVLMDTKRIEVEFGSRVLTNRERGLSESILNRFFRNIYIHESNERNTNEEKERVLIARRCNDLIFMSSFRDSFCSVFDSVLDAVRMSCPGRETCSISFSCLTSIFNIPIRFPFQRRISVPFCHSSVLNIPYISYFLPFLHDTISSGYIITYLPSFDCSYACLSSQSKNREKGAKDRTQFRKLYIFSSHLFHPSIIAEHTFAYKSIYRQGNVCIYIFFSLCIPCSMNLRMTFYLSFHLLSPEEVLEQRTIHRIWLRWVQILHFFPLRILQLESRSRFSLPRVLIRVLELRTLLQFWWKSNENRQQSEQKDWQVLSKF